MENYEIIIKEGQNPAWVVRKEREAREKGKIPVVACSNETKSIFERLIKRFDPDEKTISIFQSGFNDLKLTYLLRYVFYNSLQGLNDVRPVDYIDEVFSLANGLKGDVREFFLNEFEFEFERENSLDKNLWVTRDKILNEFKERRKQSSQQETRESILPLQLSNRYGAKADFLRVMNALFELMFFNDSDGSPLTKADFMQRIGQFFSVDLSGYADNLNQAYNSTKGETANLKIFEQMIKKTKKHIRGESD